MDVVLDYAEEKLLSTLQKIKSGVGNAGCLHIKGSLLNQLSFIEVPGIIKDWIGHEEEGSILVCHDKDIFIFARTISFKLFIKFREKFYKYLEMDEKLNVDLMSFYDVNVNALGLIELAQAKLDKKIANKKMAEEKARQNSKEKQREEILSLPLNPKAIETLDARRNERDKINILIVEDDAFSRRLVGTALQGSYALTFAERGREAILSYLDQAPDIVFLDIDLPDLTGHDVLKKLIEIDPKGYFVMLSGNGNLDNIKKAIATGAKGFIGKPFTKEKLIQYINKCRKKETV